MITLTDKAAEKVKEIREAESLGLTFLQVELDAAEHATYRFVPGVATTSLAQQTAQRLGVTREQLRDLIRRSPS